MPNLPYQLGRTYVVGSMRVHTRTIFSQRMGAESQRLLPQCLNRANAALTHCIAQAALRASVLRNGIHGIGFDLEIPDLGPFDVNFRNRFIQYFRVDAADPDFVADTMDTFRNCCVSIQRGLQGTLDIVDLPIMRQGGNTCGYVNRYEMLDGTLDHRGSIHIDFGRISAANIDGVATTFIHEGAHKFVGAKDHAYEWERIKWRNLTSRTAIENADSSARFAMAALAGNLL